MQFVSDLDLSGLLKPIVTSTGTPAFRNLSWTWRYKTCIDIWNNTILVAHNKFILFSRNYSNFKDIGFISLSENKSILSNNIIEFAFYVCSLLFKYFTIIITWKYVSHKESSGKLNRNKKCERLLWIRKASLFLELIIWLEYENLHKSYFMLCEKNILVYIT